MTNKSRENPLVKSNQENEFTKPRILLLFNDDVNTFDYVIESLIEVCNHTGIQAEQCAMLAHYKGQSEVKTGDLETLKNMQSGLTKKGLMSIIE